MEFEKWVPIEGIPEKMDLMALHQDQEGFRLLLIDEEGFKLLRIYFVPFLSYRSSDEMNLPRTMSEVEVGGVFFIVRDSEFVKWFLRENLGTYPPDNVVHYAIYTEDACVDVITSSAPKVEWL